MKGQKTIKMEFTKRNSEQGEGRVRSENCSEAEELQLLEKKYLQILYQTSCKPEIVIVGFNLWSCWLSFTRVRFSFGQKIPLKEPREVGNYGARWKQAWCEPHGAWSHLWEFTASTAAAPVGSRSTDREISTSKPAQTRALHPHPNPHHPQPWSRGLEPSSSQLIPKLLCWASRGTGMNPSSSSSASEVIPGERDGIQFKEPPTSRKAGMIELSRVRSCHGCAVGNFILNYFLQRTQLTSQSFILQLPWLCPDLFEVTWVTHFSLLPLQICYLLSF